VRDVVKKAFLGRGAVEDWNWDRGVLVEREYEASAFV
jgi:hypothetical protein